MNGCPAPQVSVLLPVYNSAGTLNEALESLSAQSFRDFEIVAVDDGSTDGSGLLLSAWAARDPRLRVLARPYTGLVAALNAGLAACRAPLVARMDADDRCHPDRLALQAAFLHAHPEIALVSCCVTAFPDEEVRSGLRLYLEWQNLLLADEALRRELFVESPFVHPSVMFRREAVLRAGGYEEQGWPEDYDLWLRLALAGAKFARLPEVLLNWRERPDRLTRTDGRYSLQNFLRLKAHYLLRGPLSDRDGVFIWGAGSMGKRLGRELAGLGAPLEGYFDIDPRKVGRSRRGLPVLPPAALPEWRSRFGRPAILAAVGTRGARPVVRRRMESFDLVEARDWWFAA